MPDRDVPENARVVVGIDAAVRDVCDRESGDRQALDRALPKAQTALLGIVHRGIAQQHEATPELYVPLPGLVERRKGRGRRRIVEEGVTRIPEILEPIRVGIVGYGWMARYTLAFMDAYLKHDAEALSFLKKTAAENAVPKHFMFVTYRGGGGV